MNTDSAKKLKTPFFLSYGFLYFMDIAVATVPIILLSNKINIMKFTSLYSEMGYKRLLLPDILDTLPKYLNYYIAHSSRFIFIFSLVAIVISFFFYFKKEKKFQHLFLMLATGLNVVAGLYYLLMHLFWANFVYSGTRNFMIFYCVLILAGIVSLIRWIFFHKIKEEISNHKKTPIILFVILVILSCLCLAQPFIALGAENKEAHFILQARTSQDRTFDETIGYQIGNYIHKDGIYANGKVYYTIKNSTTGTYEIRSIDKSGNVELFWVASDDINNVSSAIYYHDEYLYISAIAGDSSYGYDRVLRISIKDRQEEILLESENNIKYIGIHNNLLLVDSYDRTTEQHTIYAYDLALPVTEDNGYIYDDGIPGMIVEHSFWVNQFLYGNYNLHVFDDSGMSLENIGYSITDHRDLYWTNDGICWDLYRNEENLIDSDVIALNIFNNQIYYIKYSEDRANYELYSCKPYGENKVLICTMPTDTISFDNYDYMIMAEDFVVIKTRDDETAYMMWLDDGSYEKLW